MLQLETVILGNTLEANGPVRPLNWPIIYIFISPSGSIRNNTRSSATAEKQRVSCPRQGEGD